jgi:post-segregation antitoxin (ccd killing protein)
MPNQLSDAKKRITYTEFGDVYSQLKELAMVSRVDISQLVRTATSEFLRKRKHKVWKAAAYDSPAEMRNSEIRRVSYTEWRDVDEELTAIATEERLDKSDLLRAAVNTYLKTRKQ